MLAIAKQPTKLTKEAVDSSSSPSGFVFDVLPGSEFHIRAIAPQLKQGKRLVTLAGGVGPQNFNTWYLFEPHWELKPEPKQPDYPEATEPKDAAESSQQVAPSPRIIRPGDIDWAEGDHAISEFFTVFEVTKGDPRRRPAKNSIVERNILRMADELDKIRREWGSAIAVTSWYRPEAVNRAVGGARLSQHLNGGAVDIYAVDGNDYRFEDFLDRHWGGGLGYGIASGRIFTHLDLRDGGWRRGPGTIRWVY
ncbi:MAG: D-Ala-D-Ala carboxypeptidase family metallohydrolase [Thermosynechococcaceae cyanobacterium MS004]|nr:D-Ala-D-Ala carboxypeptidase family metallohydrolase [Thermosynechococcaceae cyanobacterium MS004]